MIRTEISSTSAFFLEPPFPIPLTLALLVSALMRLHLRCWINPHIQPMIAPLPMCRVWSPIGICNNGYLLCHPVCAKIYGIRKLNFNEGAKLVPASLFFNVYMPPKGSQKNNLSNFIYKKWKQICVHLRLSAVCFSKYCYLIFR